MDFTFLHTLNSYLHAHPHIGGLITFFIAFAESLPLVGAIIPGSVTMTAIGVLIGSSVMPATATILWAISGALCGDYLSYWAGAYYNERLRNMWPFRKYPHWLTVGENFFRKHGGKSVVLGRFFGPVRSAVPLIAGLLHMQPLRFVIAAIPAVILWSLIYMGPGILVGALSLELPPATATKFILGMLAIVAFSWVIFLVIHLFFKKIASTIDTSSKHLWIYLNTHKPTHWLTTLLSNPYQTNPHRQLIVLVAGLLSFCLFLWILVTSILQMGVLIHLNVPLFELFRSFRTYKGDDFMLPATILGDKLVLLPAAFLIGCWLVWRRYFWVAFHWLAVVILSAGAVEFFKRIYYSPRPSGLLNVQITSSFPSGHTVLSVACFGFLAMLIASSLEPGKRKIPYVVACFLSLWVMLSRLYLGAHWLTDVLGGFFLAISCILLVTLSYNRRAPRHSPLVWDSQTNATPDASATRPTPKSIDIKNPHRCKSFSLVAIGAILMMWVGYGLKEYTSIRNDYLVYWPTVAVDKQTWWLHENNQIPLLIISRLGKPHEVLNVQWLGSLSYIEALLIKQGWEPHPAQINIQETLHRLTARHNAQHLPLLPDLYQNHTPVLLLTKFDNHHRQINFTLWKSNVFITDSTTQKLWLGSIHYYGPTTNHTKSSLPPDQLQQLDAQAHEILINDLNKQQLPWKIITVLPNQFPPLKEPLNWNGQLFLIQSN